MNVYFISGLGVDERAFKNIILPENYSVHNIRWIELLEKESLESYSTRLIAQIDQQKPFALVGLSFGGMIAAEISNQIPVNKTNIDFKHFLIKTTSLVFFVSW